MTTKIFYIPNISCNHCVHTIQSEVSEIAGVTSVTADVSSKKVTITYTEPATEDQIKDVLKEINYPVGAQ